MNWTGQRNRQRTAAGTYSRRAILGGGAAAATAIACSNKPQASGAVKQAGTQSSGDRPQLGGTLTLPATGNAILDPHRTPGNTTMNLMGGILSRLFRYKTGPTPQTGINHELEPDLALSSESPDAVTWTFKLRPGATFHDVPPVNGHPVTSEDVKATFVRALDPKNPSSPALGMIDVNHIETPAADRISFTLAYPYAPFAETMASGTYSWIMPREALAGTYDPAKQVIGSGPFLFESYTPDVAYVLKRNPVWFEVGRPYVDGIRLAIITNPAQLMAQFTAGNLDEITPAANDIPTILKSVPKAQRVTGRGTGLGGLPLYMQLGDPKSVFQDVRVRRAISMAIDRSVIGKTVYDNEYDLSFAVPPGFGKWSIKADDLDAKSAHYYTFDPKETKQLLAEAGMPNLTVKFEYGTNFTLYDSTYYITQYQIINNMLNNAGIKTQLVALDYLKDVIGNGKGARFGNFPGDALLSTGVSGFSNVDELIFAYFSSKNPNTQTQLHDPQLDSMMDKARKQVKEEDRVSAYRDIEKYIAGQVYTIAGFPQGYDYRLLQPRIQNYNYSNTLGFLAEVYSKVWLQK